ncbi:MAG: hypothetical protein C0625_00260 [Arcobacter sp.]|nr:MAG: hypothetical protein C0625_00260 [Arcobacter sp.]
MKTIILVFLAVTFNYASVVSEYLNSLESEVKKENPSFKGFDIQRGEKIFTSKHIGKKGKEISCVSCHTNNFSQNGENFFTGKVIKPLSPVANPKRFSKLKDIKKWLRRNFNDVYKREGTALEKGDVVTYILSKD